jgi:class 3 adenylate cyclase
VSGARRVTWAWSSPVESPCRCKTAGCSSLAPTTSSTYPGHDGWTIGDEPCVQIEWAGLHTFAGLGAGLRGRALVTLLFTDLVDSTATAKQLGDKGWRDLLTAHFEAIRAELDRFGGREVDTTGDGMLATFDGPAPALHCSGAIRRSAARQGLRIRAGVHVGEVELVGGRVRGRA